MAGSAGAVAFAASGSAWWLHGPPAPVGQIPDPEAARFWLQAIATSARAEALGPWPLPQVLEHLAQSVEYSLDGYPQLNSPLFRASVGPIAFRAFVRRGRMTHATDAPIPGAPALAERDLAVAVRRLEQALERFEATPAGSAFAPHFAYGALGKDDYRRAHLMHLADHARQIVVG